MQSRTEPCDHPRPALCETRVLGGGCGVQRGTEEERGWRPVEPVAEVVRDVRVKVVVLGEVLLGAEAAVAVERERRRVGRLHVEQHAACERHALGVSCLQAVSQLGQQRGGNALALERGQHAKGHDVCVLCLGAGHMRRTAAGELGERERGGGEPQTGLLLAEDGLDEGAGRLDAARDEADNARLGDGEGRAGLHVRDGDERRGVGLGDERLQQRARVAHGEQRRVQRQHAVDVLVAVRAVLDTQRPFTHLPPTSHLQTDGGIRVTTAQ